jgi:hypothetical protein
VPR